MSKTVNIQPWIDCFKMLHRYEQKGLLQTDEHSHEAYITQPALHAMTPGDDPIKQVKSGAIIDTLHRIRTYCAWLHAGYIGLQQSVIIHHLPQAKTILQYEREPFSLHIVQEDVPHGLIYTIFASRRRRWFWPLRKMEHVEVINYEDGGE